jgi:hypothetical protein
MENIIITRPRETAESLAELAVQINAEHGHVESAIRDGLAHARQAGLLLLQAKTRVPHGNFLPWLQANFKATSRTARRYMQIAEHWEEVVAKGGTSLGLHGALKLLTRQNDKLAQNGRARPFCPPALAYYHQNGLIDEGALRQLLDLQQDFGPEILTQLRFSPPPTEIRHGWLLLNMLRPLDHPPLWPRPVDDDTTAGASLLAALEIFFNDGHQRDSVPQWEVAAFWFAATIAHLAATYPEFFDQKLSAILYFNLEIWRESFRAALVWEFERNAFKCDNEVEERRFFWGYKSDLRHAGVSRAVEEMRRDPNSHPSLRNSLDAGFDHFVDLGTYPEPSNMQGRLDRCTEGELGRPANTPRGDAPEDELFAEPDTETAE